MVQMSMRDLKKVSALWSFRFRVSALERFCYKRFLRNSSGIKFFVRLREVSALEDVRFREVPLYLSSKAGQMKITIEFSILELVKITTFIINRQFDFLIKFAFKG